MIASAQDEAKVAQDPEVKLTLVIVKIGSVS